MAKDNLMQCNLMEEPKILAQIFSYLSPNELKPLRLISTFWNSVVCSFLQQTELVEFHQVTCIARYLSIFFSSASNPHPHARYAFYKIRLNLIHDNYLLRTFFKKINNLSLAHLQLDFSGNSFRLKYFRMCVLEHLSNCKSLALNFKDFYDIWPASLKDDECSSSKKLKCVRSLSIYGFGRESTLREVLGKLLPYFPNVVELEAGEQIGRLIFELSAESPLPLSLLNFNYIYPSTIDFIIGNKMKLKKIVGELHMCNEFQSEELLKFLAPTLEFLYLECPTPLKFLPQVPLLTLKELELKRFRIELPKSLEKLPALRKLKLKMVQFSTNKVLPGPNLNLVWLTLEICEVNEKILKLFTDLFPSLRVCEFPTFYDCQLLEFVLKEFKKLEQLRLDKDAVEEFVGFLSSKENLNSTRIVKLMDRDSGIVLRHFKV